MTDFLDKAQLRRLMIKKRRSHPAKVWREKSNLVCDRLESLALFQEAKTVLAYFSFKQELDLSVLFNKSDRKWGFPRCVGKSLHWHSWESGDKLLVNDFNICEPSPQAAIIASEEVDLILVPAVAIDRFGYRLGYGGGFYDRFLSLEQWSNKPTIGIVFDEAYLPKLPSDPWDLKLDYICTELICEQLK